MKISQEQARDKDTHHHNKIELCAQNIDMIDLRSIIKHKKDGLHDD